MSRYIFRSKHGYSNLLVKNRHRFDALLCDALPLAITSCVLGRGLPRPPLCCRVFVILCSVFRMCSRYFFLYFRVRSLLLSARSPCLCRSPWPTTGNAGLHVQDGGLRALDPERQLLLRRHGERLRLQLLFKFTGAEKCFPTC